MVASAKARATFDSPEYREKMRQNRLGKAMSVSAKTAIGAKLRGVSKSPEHVAHIQEAQRRPEVRAKVAAGIKAHWEKKRAEGWVDAEWENTGIPRSEVRRIRNSAIKCAICGVKFKGSVRKRTDTQWPTVHVDHNHDTGVIRGVLCGPCNRGLGFFRSTPATLRAAATYLEHQE